MLVVTHFYSQKFTRNPRLKNGQNRRNTVVSLKRQNPQKTERNWPKIWAHNVLSKWRQVNFEYKYTWNYEYIWLYLIFREKNSKLHHWKSNLPIFWFFFENARNWIKITSFLIGLEHSAFDWLIFSWPIGSNDFDFLIV